MPTFTIETPLGPTELDERAVPSAFRSLLGMRIVEWEENRCVVEIPLAPHLLNFAGVIAGPVVGAAVDMGGTLAGCFSPTPGQHLRAVTLSFTVAFMGSVSTGTVRAVAVKKGGGRKIFTSTVDVLSEQGDVIASGQGTFRYVT